MKKIITITGIRPDFIRMSNIFKKLDTHFEHVLIHTGQHFSNDLSDIFFRDLDIRQPDINWGVGAANLDHIGQNIQLLDRIDKNRSLLKSADLVLFLGDSNSVLSAVPLRKLGIPIGHIEAGMRSGDRRMLEETNRIVCDHCSDFLFTYHPNYTQHLLNEQIRGKVFTVGNTILEVAKNYSQRILTTPKRNSHILVDIHRPENFQDVERLSKIIEQCRNFGETLELPVHLLNFTRSVSALKEHRIDLDDILITSQMGFSEYLQFAYDSALVISDSGTAQEELAILKTPVLVPRDYTERPESYMYGCSLHLDITDTDTLGYLERAANLKFDTSWLGDGQTSDSIVSILKEEL